MIFELKIWYRYTVKGEQEKDFDHFKVEALNIHTAFSFIKKIKFQSNSVIPISYQQVINGQCVGFEYDPFKIKINDPNYDNPIGVLYKEY